MYKAICLVDEAIRLSPEHLTSLSPYCRVISGVNVSQLDLLDEEKQQVQILLLHSKVSLAFIEQFPALEWIGIRAKNLSYVPEEIRNDKKKKITVFGIPSLADIAVAEHAFALMLAIQKNLLAGDRNVREGLWRQNLPINTELFEKKLGIIGYGVIGQRIAKIAEAFGMKILITRSPKSTNTEHLPLEEMLPQADIVSLHISSAPENVGFINKRVIALMKKGAILINTSRGDMVDEEALLQALNCCWAGGLWKGCIGPIVDKWQLWNSKWINFGIPPDPAWD